MKHEWKKTEKKFYLPKAIPEIIDIPAFKFFSIQGTGNPNNPEFGDYIGVLYSLAYGIKMTSKKELSGKDIYDYTVYPLEGVWDLTEKGREKYNGKIDKDELVFNLMIRQPDFVEENFAQQILDQTHRKKPHPLLDKVKFETFTEGKCIQILHNGSYDSEPASFKLMEAFAKQQNLNRACMTHREIYLSDARKVAPDKLKTVLRFKVN
jgi:hypothetical protein